MDAVEAFSRSGKHSTWLLFPDDAVPVIEIRLGMSCARIQKRRNEKKEKRHVSVLMAQIRGVED